MPKVIQISPPTEDAQPSGETILTSVAEKRRGQRLVATLLRNKVRTMFRHFPAALSGDVEAIHQLRVAGRRLRVALLLLVDKPDGRRANRVQKLLRQLTRTAGSGRDLDVLLETYGAHLKELPRRSIEQQRLRHRMADARRRGRARMVEALLDLEISRLRSDLAVLLDRVEASLPIVGERFAGLCAGEGGALVDGLAAVGALLDPAALHSLRRRARRLRYGAEVFERVFDLDTGANKTWKSLQDLIGVIHDHHMLAEWFEGQAGADEKRGEAALAAAARSEAEWARSTMARLHDAFLAANPSALVVRGLSALGYSPQVHAS